MKTNGTSTEPDPTTWNGTIACAYSLGGMTIDSVMSPLHVNVRAAQPPPSAETAGTTIAMTATASTTARTVRFMGTSLAPPVGAFEDRR